jgi:tetratricopeptide (TPR) repeat protein
MEAAVDLFRSYIAEIKTTASAFSGLGLCLRRLGQFPEAIAMFHRALAIAPKNAALLNQFGSTLIRAGDLDKAATVFEQAIGIAPDNLQPYLSLSAIQKSRGNESNARRTLRAGVNRKPISTTICFGTPRARILRLRGVQNAYYTLGKSRNGRHKLKLRGGNFSSRYFWDSAEYTTINYMVLNNNLTQPNRIPKFDIVINTIADPDLETASLLTAAKFLAQNPELPFINDPLQVLETTREKNYHRLVNIDGINMAKTLRVPPEKANKEDLTRLLEEHKFKFPILLRETGTHTGRTFIKADTLEEFVAAAEELSGAELYLIQFVENLFQEKYHRKIRFFCIDGKLYPVVLHIDETWNVHGSNRKTLMAQHEWMIEEEKSFMADPEAYLGAENYARLNGLHELVGLDFFGFDFNLTDDGELLIFELNPAMRHAYDHAANFEYLQPHMERVTQAFRDMIDARIKK